MGALSTDPRVTQAMALADDFAHSAVEDGRHLLHPETLADRTKLEVHIASMAAEISRLNSELELADGAYCGASSTLRTALDELDEAMKDANRYHWLRDAPDADTGLLDWCDEEDRLLIDARIDAAMTKEKP